MRKQTQFRLTIQCKQKSLNLVDRCTLLSIKKSCTVKIIKLQVDGRKIQVIFYPFPQTFSRSSYRRLSSCVGQLLPNGKWRRKKPMKLSEIQGGLSRWPPNTKAATLEEVDLVEITRHPIFFQNRFEKLHMYLLSWMARNDQKIIFDILPDCHFPAESNERVLASAPSSSVAVAVKERPKSAEKRLQKGHCESCLETGLVKSGKKKHLSNYENFRFWPWRKSSAEFFCCQKSSSFLKKKNLHLRKIKEQNRHLQQQQGMKMINWHLKKLETRIVESETSRKKITNFLLLRH